MPPRRKPAAARKRPAASATAAGSAPSAPAVAEELIYAEAGVVCAEEAGPAAETAEAGVWAGVPVAEESNEMEVEDAAVEGNDVVTSMEAVEIVVPAEPACEEETEEVEEDAEEVEEDSEEVEAEADEDEGKEEEAANSSGEGVAAAATADAADDTNEVAEEDPEKVEDEATHGDDAEDGDVDQLNDVGDIGGSESENDDAQHDEVDPTLFSRDPVSEGKDKDLEIFVGGLPKDCVEEDITKVFSEFGEIQSVKIVKNPATQKSKGFAFVRYVNIEAAKKALAEFKEGTEVKGKKVGISASQDNNTLYVGNICKTWTKDQVLDTLKHLGIEEFEMSFPDDPDTEGGNKGFALLEFASHSDAVAAFQRLRKPDAVFGMSRSAKVSFSQTPIKPNEELLMKVKTVYLEHVPLSWDEEKIKECCKEYGEIQKVVLFRKLKKTKKKDFSFVEFNSRENALACVEGINNANIGDGEIKLTASLARPPAKGRMAKQGTKGGYKVNNSISTKDANQSKNKKAKAQKKEVKKNAQQKAVGSKQSKVISRGAAEKPQTSRPFKGKRQAGRSKNTFINERPSKKARTNRDAPTKPSNIRHVRGFGNVRGAYSGQPVAGHMMHPAGPRYATNYQAYPSAGASSRSNARAYDLEPHAGYLPHANRVQNTYAYDQQRAAPYNSHQMHVPPYPAGQAAPRPAYSGYTRYTGYQAGHVYPPAPSGSYAGSGPYDPRRGYY